MREKGDGSPYRTYLTYRVWSQRLTCRETLYSVSGKDVFLGGSEREAILMKVTKEVTG